MPVTVLNFLNVCTTHDFNNNVYNPSNKSTVDSDSEGANTGNEDKVKIIPHCLMRRSYLIKQRSAQHLSLKQRRDILLR